MLLRLQQPLRQEFIWDLLLDTVLLLPLAVKRQHTLQLMVLAVLRLLVVQCYPVTIYPLKIIKVSDFFIFRILFPNVNVIFKETLGQNWIFDPVVSNYLGRFKIIIKDTRSSQYLKGDYEDQKGRILAATEIPAAFEQTARVKFDNSGEERSIVVRYIRPQPPTYTGEQVLVLEGKHRGKVMVVREKPEEDDAQIVASSIANSDIDNVPAYASVPLFDDDPMASS